jgi:hypothetical protein
VIAISLQRFIYAAYVQNSINIICVYLRTINNSLRLCGDAIKKNGADLWQMAPFFSLYTLACI